MWQSIPNYDRWYNIIQCVVCRVYRTITGGIILYNVKTEVFKPCATIGIIIDKSR